MVNKPFQAEPAEVNGKCHMGANGNGLRSSLPFKAAIMRRQKHIVFDWDFGPELPLCETLHDLMPRTLSSRMGLRSKGRRSYSLSELQDRLTPSILDTSRQLEKLRALVINFCGGPCDFMSARYSTRHLPALLSPACDLCKLLRCFTAVSLSCTGWLYQDS